MPVKSAPSAVQPDRSAPLKSAEERSQFERFVDACGWIQDDDVIDCGGHSECILPRTFSYKRYIQKIAVCGVIKQLPGWRE